MLRNVKIFDPCLLVEFNQIHARKKRKRKLEQVSMNTSENVTRAKIQMSRIKAHALHNVEYLIRIGFAMKEGFLTATSCNVFHATARSFVFFLPFSRSLNEPLDVYALHRARTASSRTHRVHALATTL